jgi:membrane-bound ClpP family serine protease
MTPILLLFVVGSLLLAAEALLPGAIAGILGGIALCVGSVLAFTQFGFMAGTLATLAALVLVAVMLYVELVWLPRTRMGRGMVVEATIDAQATTPAAANEVLGQVAIALTTLAPSGFVNVAGKRYEAFCRTGHAMRGAVLTVVGVDNFRLIVSESKAQ